MMCWIHPKRTCDTDCPAYLTLEASEGDVFIHGLNLWQHGGLLEEKYAGMRTCCSIVYSIFVFADAVATFPLNKKEEDEDS